jgi:signal transduction histidine kinase
LANGAAIALENARLLEQTKKQAGELEKANKVKDEFLGFVSHELRTPVNAVVGYTAMIQDGMLGEISPEQRKMLEKVIGRSRDLLGMINGLLEATRIEAGAVEVEGRAVGLGHFLDELRSSYDVPLGKGLTLNWDYPSDLPVVKTDSEKLKHILQNLINNAIKYTDRGDVRVSARLSPQGSVKFVEFKVSDTGVGIPRESLPFIFEMFRQVDGSRGGRRGGVGLGLHIVKSFTELLGGEIGVESELGKGSTFTVTIPCEGCQSEVSEEPSGAGAVAANQLWEPRSAKGNRGDSNQSGVGKKGS